MESIQILQDVLFLTKRGLMPSLGFRTKLFSMRVGILFIYTRRFTNEDANRLKESENEFHITQL